jgi:transcriptional regulator with XRE-family HTH domain
MGPNSPDIREDGLRELREIRLRRGLSQADLSAMTGVAEFTISEIESGKRANPRPSTLRKLAQALEVEVADLYGEPAVPLAEAPREAGSPRVSKERLQEYFEDVQQNEVDYLNWVIADLWRLALPDEKPQAHFVPDDVNPDRAWSFLEHAFAAGNVFVPEERERLNRGARKLALTGGG